MENIHNIKLRYRAKSMRDVVFRLERLVVKKNEELVRLGDFISLTTGMSTKVYRGTGPHTPHDPGDLGCGRYHTTNKERAYNYGNVEEHSVRFDNPLVMRERDAYTQIADRFNTIHASDRKAACLDAMAWIKEQGHDGVVSLGQDGSCEVVTYPEI